MQLPPSTSSYSVRVRYGRYVARRLRRAGLAKLASDLLTSTLNLRTLGRALEDADDGIQDALADRDAADDSLDSLAQDARAKLAGTSATAAKEEPYTLVFPDGVTYYTAAPLDEEATRYGELVSRTEEHLPAKHEVRTAIHKGVPKGLTDFASATKELAAARTAEALAGTRLDSAEHAWERQVEKVYASLVEEFGRAKADGFFPKVRGPRTKAATGGSAGAGNGASAGAGNGAGATGATLPRARAARRISTSRVRPPDLEQEGRKAGRNAVDQFPLGPSRLLVFL